MSINNTSGSTIHVACSIDGNYLRYCIVMLTSLLENNRDLDIRIHLTAPLLEDAQRKQLTEIVEDKYHKSIVFYAPEEDMLSECKVNENGYISLATYYRVFLDRILPADIEKVLYLDCDLIVNGSIMPLWAEDISAVSLGAVDDMWSARPESYERLGYPSESGYFNAGVLLMNLQKLRRDNFAARAIEFLKKNADRLVFYDQDVLNALLHDDKKLLPLRWNVQDGFLRRRRISRMRADSLAVIDEELTQSAIIHYTGSKKPWHYKSQHPWRSLYFKYLDLTPYRGERPSTPTGYRMLTGLNRTLEFLRLKKRKYLKCPKIDSIGL